jgi:Zn-dependent protease
VDSGLFVQVLGTLLLAVVIHEYAHGWMALRLGDPTAKLSGRLSLNPLRHVDFIGTFVVPLVLTMVFNVPFGWAKPVPVNFSRLRYPKRDMIWVAAAGPVVNVVLAFLLSPLLRLSWVAGLHGFLNRFLAVNLALALFNLIPVPPLDGSRILTGVLPRRWAKAYVTLEPFGFIILFLLIKFNLLNFMMTPFEYLSGKLGVDITLL